MNGETPLLERLLKWGLFVVAAIVAIKLAFWLLGMAVGLVFFVLFTVVPLAVVGWIVVKLFRVFFPRDDEYRPA
jgi:hypothetical protein